VSLKRLLLILLFFVAGNFHGFAQEEVTIKVKDSVRPLTGPPEFDPLSPSRAAFYSAILPGLGQAYNKKYWKVPIVWGALGTSTYFYIENNKNFNRARDAYKLRLNGKPDEFDGQDGNIYLSNDALVRAQRTYKKDRDLSLIITIGLYVLQILEASTNAHLLNHNVDNNISFKPEVFQDLTTERTMIGASFKYNF
jgi:hypothetical protein